MVEFEFDISPLFTKPIVNVTSNLLPHTFHGNNYERINAISKMSTIIDHLGKLSANAQSLRKPVTTADRLRLEKNQKIYLLADKYAGMNGAVIGLLKIGSKQLYLFDEAGQMRRNENTPCILDFYIHETKQRSGFGKSLYESMLLNENLSPIKCSVDRPSHKLLGFLKKHYGLERCIPQANNFVLYEGFFDDGEKQVESTTNSGNNKSMKVTRCPSVQHIGNKNVDIKYKMCSPRHLDSANMPPPVTKISTGGRYGAACRSSSMADIIHYGATTPRKRLEK